MRGAARCVIDTGLSYSKTKQCLISRNDCNKANGAGQEYEEGGAEELHLITKQCISGENKVDERKMTGTGSHARRSILVPGGRQI